MPAGAPAATCLTAAPWSECGQAAGGQAPGRAVGPLGGIACGGSGVLCSSASLASLCPTAPSRPKPSAGSPPSTWTERAAACATTTGRAAGARSARPSAAATPRASLRCRTAPAAGGRRSTRSIAVSGKAWPLLCVRRRECLCVVVWCACPGGRGLRGWTPRGASVACWQTGMLRQEARLVAEPGTCARS